MKKVCLRPATNPADPRRAAFSRVELLVVMSVVALLAGLVLADVGGSGRGARRLLCLENLRRLAGASALYATDNQDRLPHCTWATVGGSSGPNGWCYAAYLPDKKWIPGLAGFANNERQLPFLRAGQLWPYVREERAFLCPEDSALSQSSQASLWRARPQKVISYFMNAAVISFGRLPYSTEASAGQSANTQPLSRFAPNAVLFWEGDESVPESFNNGAGSPSEGISGRHGPTVSRPTTAAAGLNGGQMGCFDGSALFVTKSEYYEESGGALAPSRLPKALPNRLWCDPDSPTGGY